MLKEYSHGTAIVGWSVSMEMLEKINENKKENLDSKLYPWLDFGVGFYLTDDEKMAAKWAVYQSIENSEGDITFDDIRVNPDLLGFIRIYKLDLDSYPNKDKILDLSNFTVEDNLLKTFAMYLAYNSRYLFRALNDENEFIEFENEEQKNKALTRFYDFISRYAPENWEEKEIIIAYRLDSRYRHALNDFALGRIKEEDIPDIMKIGNFGLQYFFKGKTAEEFINNSGDPVDKKVGLDIYKGNVVEMETAYTEVSDMVQMNRIAYDNKLIPYR